MQRDVNSVWRQCLDIIKDNVSPESYRNWFEPIEPVKLNKNKITLRVPSAYYYEYLEEHYLGLLSKALKQTIGPNAKLEYEIVAIKNNGQKNNGKGSRLYVLPGNVAPQLKNEPVNTPVATEEISNPQIIPGIGKRRIDSNLKPDYTFDNFIEGDCNRLARNAGIEIAKNPGKSHFNPLMIYGPTGTGKTHLAQAIGIKIKENFPKHTVLYISAAKFEEQFTTAIRNNEINKFIRFYSLIDVLIVDDIQELAGKQKTQQKFFNIFNTLHLENKQIVLTSDRPPVDLDGMEERLVTRLKWGLTAELKHPDFETRLKILKYKTYQGGYNIPDRILRYLAENVATNIRELEGALNSLIAYSIMYKNTRITLDMAKNVVKNLVKERRKEITIDYILRTVSEYFKLDQKVILSKARTREIVLARQIAMYLARKYTEASLSRIGAELGRRDHSTVLHAFKTVEDLMATDKNVKQYVEDISRTLQY